MVNSLGIDPRIDVRVTTCKTKTIDSLGCHQSIIKKFGAINIKLVAEDEHDEVDGFAQVDSNGCHVALYTKTQEPNKEHKTTLKKCKNIPTIATVDEKIKDAIR